MLAAGIAAAAIVLVTLLIKENSIQHGLVPTALPTFKIPFESKAVFRAAMELVLFRH